MDMKEMNEKDKAMESWLGWHMPVTPVLRRKNQV